jgi:hypothetical protein
MLKHVYRAIILIAIFVGALYYFSKDIKEVVFNVDNTTAMEEVTFPMVTIKVNDCRINMLHGYSSNIAANKIREAVTPLGTDQTFEVLFKNQKIKIKKINYEVREFVSNQLIENSSLSVFEKNGDYQSAKIKLNTPLTAAKEYAVKITLVTSKSEKIYYYHRVKVYEEAHVKDDIDFVLNFHNSVLDKKTAQSMEMYLSTPTSLNDSSLAYVTMDNSKLDMISWGNLNPVVITEVIPTVKEIYENMASIELNYFIEAKVNGNTERYRVSEFFRVHYDTDRMHLYNYERRMESVFDINLVNPDANQFKLGVTSDLEIPYMKGTDNNKLAFVRDRSLWLYDTKNNEITRVFSFVQKDSDYIRDQYDQHDIRIINMDAEGNMDFMVYGYMNRGQYEGHVGVLLYHFVKSENRIQEMVYIPVEESYQSLKENLGVLSYVNANDVFYFNLYDTIYSYSIITRKLSVIASNVDQSQVVILPGKNCVAWQESGDLKNSKNINIINMETNKIQTITANSGYNIRLLEKIDSNIVYGYIENNNIVSLIDGSIIAPISTVEIATSDKEVLKTYKKSGYYITGASVKDNILELRRIKKAQGNGQTTYEAASSDYIMNQVKSGTSLLGVVAKNSDQALTEYYLTLPKEYTIKKKPKIATTVNTVISEDPTVRLPETEQHHIYYYPYVTGGIEGAYENAADAIAVARDKLGVVVSSKQQLVWERGLQSMISEKVIPRYQTITWSSNYNKTVENCIKLMLANQGVNVSLDELNVQNSSAYEVLKNHSKYAPIRLTGTSLDDALYYITMGKPILGMKDSTHAVLIYGYDPQNIMVIDPTKGSTMRIGINDARQMFESAGNVFISYLDQ